MISEYLAANGLDEKIVDEMSSTERENSAVIMTAFTEAGTC